MRIFGKTARISYPLAILVSFMVIYALRFGGATRWILQAKKAVKDDPAIARVPAPLADTSASAAPGTTIFEFGFQFEVPWAAKIKASQDDYGAVVLSSDKAVSLTFFNPAQSRGLVKDLREGLKQRGENPAAANLYLDASSDYDLERSTWYATPDQLSLFFPRRKEIFAATRLMMKRDTEPLAKTGVFTFAFGQLRGFQFGDPGQTPQVRVEAFDERDQKFVFMFSSRPGAAPALKQGDINRVLQTLRKAPLAP